MLFESASWNFPRVETLLIESTYGAKEDIQSSREEVESIFIKSVNETLRNGGKVLIPIPAVGRHKNKAARHKSRLSARIKAIKAA